MADQHIGYPGSVNSAQTADWLPNVGAAQYSVDGLTDAQVVPNAIGDRGVTVKKGKIIGDGILDIFETDTNMNFGSVATGSPDRWDMIVLRRTWNATVGASTSIYTIIPGGSNKSLPSRNTAKGTVADQPIALCRLKAGNTSVQEIVDLRVWAHNGGVSAVDELAMSYLDNPGTMLYINGASWVRTPLGGQMAWVRTGQTSSIQLFGAPVNALAGSANPQDLVTNMTGFLFQAGSNVITTDASGYARLTFPKAFPNGLITVMGFNGDGWAAPGLRYESAGRQDVFGPSGYGAKNDWVYQALDSVGNRVAGKIHRLNWIAIGW